jgi:hypothetical protein
VHPGNLLDVAPQDVLAVAVARAVETGDTGGPYWVAYGADGMTIEQTLDIIGEHARAHGREIGRTPVADPDLPFPVPLESIPARSRAYLKVLVDVSEVTRASGGVLPSSLPLLQERFGVPAASDTEAYRRSLEFWWAERNRARQMAEAR